MTDLVILDIETLPDEEFLADEWVKSRYLEKLGGLSVPELEAQHQQDLARVEPASNVVTEQAKQNSIERRSAAITKKFREDVEKRQQAEASLFDDAALDPILGKICAVGYAHLDEFDPCAFLGEEPEVLDATLGALSKLQPDYIVCGFNVNRFDLPFLHYRCGVHGLRAKRAALPRLYDRFRVFDLFDLFGRKGELDLHLRRMFRGEMHKLGSGVDIKSMTADQREAYVKQDVRCARDLVRRFEWAIPSARSKKWD